MSVYFHLRKRSLQGKLSGKEKNDLDYIFAKRAILDHPNTNLTKDNNHVEDNYNFIFYIASQLIKLSDIKFEKINFYPPSDLLGNKGYTISFTCINHNCEHYHNLFIALNDSLNFFKYRLSYSYKQIMIVLTVYGGGIDNIVYGSLQRGKIDNNISSINQFVKELKRKFR